MGKLEHTGKYYFQVLELIRDGAGWYSVNLAPDHQTQVPGLESQTEDLVQRVTAFKLWAVPFSGSTRDSVKALFPSKEVSLISRSWL